MIWVGISARIANAYVRSANAIRPRRSACPRTFAVSSGYSLDATAPESLTANSAAPPDVQVHAQRMPLSGYSNRFAAGVLASLAGLVGRCENVIRLG